MAAQKKMVPNFVFPWENSWGVPKKGRGATQLRRFPWTPSPPAAAISDLATALGGKGAWPRFPSEGLAFHVQGAFTNGVAGLPSLHFSRRKRRPWEPDPGRQAGGEPSQLVE